MQNLNLRLTRDNLSRPWGFRLQGGFDSGCPLSVQRVFSGSPAEGILQKGDVIKLLDNTQVETLSNKRVQDIIRASGRQLNFIIERDPNQEDHKGKDHVSLASFPQPTNIYDDDQHDEAQARPKVDVQAARRKFLNSENRAPPPFGQFGTQYEKKNNSIPTGEKLEMEHQFNRNDDELLTPKNFRQVSNQPHMVQSSSSIMFDEEPEERVDYSFMTLPVSERSKMFGDAGHPHGRANISRTMPRQRAMSYRPNMSAMSNYSTPKFGWGPQATQPIQKRSVNLAQSSAKLERNSSNQMTRSMMNQPYKSQTLPNQFFPGETSNHMLSARIVLPNQSAMNHSLPSHGTRHVFRGGLASTNSYNVSPTRRSAEPTTLVINRSQDQQYNVQTKPLFVKTYTDYSGTTPLSPRSFKPAYPAYDSRTHNPQQQHFYPQHQPQRQYNPDQYSTISIRSEPQTHYQDQRLLYDNAGMYRIQRDITPVPAATHFNPSTNQSTRDMLSQGMDSLTMGTPRTRVVASPCSPSYHLNQNQVSGFWGTPRAPQTAPQTRRLIVQVPKSQSQVTINQSRSTGQQNPSYNHSESTTGPHADDDVDIYSQVAWMKQHRESLAGASDF